MVQVQHNCDSPEKKNRYSAFGIQFESDIILPELHASTEGSPDVKILYGNVPNEIHSPQDQNEYYQIAENEFLFTVDGVASYYVTNGEQIVVEPFNQDLRKVRLYLLGTIMGVLLMQRGILPIHGSSVVVGGLCIMFVGDSGAGKSTVAAALRNKGHSLLADDISAVKFDNNGLPWVESGYPQQKLWAASASMIGIDTTSLQRLCEDTDKYAVPVSEGFYGHQRLLNAVYEIKVQPVSNITIIPIIGIEKVSTIINNTYRLEMFKGLGLKISHFNKCATMAKHIPVFQLTRPESIPSLDRQVDVLEQHLAELFGSIEERITS